MSTITGIQTTTADETVVPACAQESPELYRFRVDQYEQMGRAGILTADDRVELVEGVLYRKPMKKGAHSIAARGAAAPRPDHSSGILFRHPRRSGGRIPGRAGMPEPDVSVVRGRSRDYAEQPEGATLRSSSRSRRRASFSTGPRSSTRTPAAGFRSTGL